MRTTLTLDKDVAATIERLRKSRDASMKAVVNEALREGLKHLDAQLSGADRVGLPAPSLVGFLRIVTNPHVTHASRR